jgi:hypothetical protein
MHREIFLPGEMIAALMWLKIVRLVETGNA